MKTGIAYKCGVTEEAHHRSFLLYHSDLTYIKTATIIIFFQVEETEWLPLVRNDLLSVRLHALDFQELFFADQVNCLLVGHRS